MLRSMSATALSGLRTTSAQQARWIQVSCVLSKEDPTPKAKRAVVSSAPEGAILKGINYMKDGKDPVALADDAYPTWLWEINDPQARAAKIADPTDKKHHKEARRQKIKADNFIRDKKT
ncbi:MAG: mitochondrial ribosomal protein L37-domain-containing protein [Benniella sp.]|nr:MAG: mitochondrial ribosomal protein L37-domain-containing protein [Benniella sp.]